MKGYSGAYEEAKTLLGGFPVDLVSVHDPDEYLAAGGSFGDILGAYESLFELKERGETEAVGVGSKDWRVIERLWRGGVKLDWAMFACAPTLLVLPPELVGFVNELKAAGVVLIDSAVFNGGFLTGGDMLDYRKAGPIADVWAFKFRERYLALCREYELDPAAPAVEYAYWLGFNALALNT